MARWSCRSGRTPSRATPGSAATCCGRRTSKGRGPGRTSRRARSAWSTADRLASGVQPKRCWCTASPSRDAFPKTRRKPFPAWMRRSCCTSRSCCAAANTGPCGAAAEPTPPRRIDATRLRRGQPARRPPLQPIHRFVLAGEDPGVEPGGAQVALRFAVDRLDGACARYQRELEFRRDVAELSHARQRIAQPVMASRVVVTRLQQRAGDLVVEAEGREGAVHRRKLPRVAALEIDAHEFPASGDAAFVAVVHGAATGSQVGLRPVITRSRTMITAITSSTWMKPPKVAEDISPTSHSRTRMNAMA